MFQTNTLRTKSLQLDIGAALVTALIIIAATWYVFDSLEQRFIQVNVADATNVNVFIDSELSNAQEQLVLFSTLSEQGRRDLAKRRLESFSDLYELDPSGKVIAVYKAGPQSQLFEGYAFTAGPVWKQLLRNSNVALLSSIVQGYEDGQPSVYVSYQTDSNTIMGRLNLEYIRSFINQYSQITGNRLLLTTNKGVVMISGDPKLAIPRIDFELLGSNTRQSDRIQADGKSWIPVVNESEPLGAKLVVLVSTQLLDAQRNTLLSALAVILAGLAITVLLKSRKLRLDILIPIGQLVSRIRAMETGAATTGSVATHRKPPKEFIEINQHFESMANAIAQREQALASAATELQNQEKELRLILEHVPIPVIVFQSKPPSPVTFINASFTEVFGYTADEVKSLDQLFRDSCQDQHTAALVFEKVQQMVLTHADTGSPRAPIEVIIACRSGVKHDVIIAAISLNDTAIATFVDVTPLRTSERELIKAKTLAEQQQQQKAQFLAMMSHEIRTPLTSILGITELLGKENLNPRQRDLVQRLIDIDHLLMRIVNDVLDHSKIEAGELKLELIKFSLTDVTHKCERMFDELSAGKGLYLDVRVDKEMPTSLIGDAFRIEQVLANLVSNAIKFTERGGVRILATCIETNSPHQGIRIEVTDTGVGIPKDLESLVFTPFKQTDTAAARRFGGTGLGLSISKKIIEAMGGTIGFSSQPGVGSTFWFEINLPVAPSDETIRSDFNLTAADASPRLDDIRVLVVEDSQAIQFLVNEMLSALGVKVTSAMDGQQALSCLSESGKQFDAVLMDIQMPNMDGIECTRAIRANPLMKSLPVIAMTADLVGPQQEEILRAGANALLHKPLTQKALAECLAKHIQDIPWRTFPNVEGIDRDHAMLMMNHNPELFNRLLRIFMQENRQVALETRDYLDRGLRDAAAKRLHSLRGGASQVGAFKVRDLAQEIESAILAKSLVSTRLTNSLDMELARIQNSMATRETIDSGG